MVVVLVHGGVGRSQVQKIIVSCLGALQVDLFDLFLSLYNRIVFIITIHVFFGVRKRHSFNPNKEM